MQDNKHLYTQYAFLCTGDKEQQCATKGKLVCDNRGTTIIGHFALELSLLVL